LRDLAKELAKMVHDAGLQKNVDGMCCIVRRKQWQTGEK